MFAGNRSYCAAYGNDGLGWDGWRRTFWTEVMINARTIRDAYNRTYSAIGQTSQTSGKGQEIVKGPHFVFKLYGFNNSSFFAP